jgi:hypothetical protein
MADTSVDVRPCMHCRKMLHREHRLPWLDLWVAEDGTVA